MHNWADLGNQPMGDTTTPPVGQTSTLNTVSPPVVSTQLYNYDTNLDDDPGRTIGKGASGATDTDPGKSVSFLYGVNQTSTITGTAYVTVDAVPEGNDPALRGGESGCLSSGRDVDGVADHRAGRPAGAGSIRSQRVPQPVVHDPDYRVVQHRGEQAHPGRRPSEPGIDSEDAACLRHGELHGRPPTSLHNREPVMSSLLSALARSGKVVRDDRGITLAETIVAMALMLVVSGIVGAAFVSNSNGTTQITDDARGQQDMQIVGERITRDIRMARGVDSGSTDSYLVIWIDNNSNYPARRRRDRHLEVRVGRRGPLPSDPLRRRRQFQGGGEHRHQRFLQSHLHLHPRPARARSQVQCW